MGTLRTGPDQSVGKLLCNTWVGPMHPNSMASAWGAFARVSESAVRCMRRQATVLFRQPDIMPIAGVLWTVTPKMLEQIPENVRPYVPGYFQPNQNQNLTYDGLSNVAGIQEVRCAMPAGVPQVISCPINNGRVAFVDGALLMLHANAQVTAPSDPSALAQGASIFLLTEADRYGLGVTYSSQAVAQYLFGKGECAWIRIGEGADFKVLRYNFATMRSLVDAITARNAGASESIERYIQVGAEELLGLLSTRHHLYAHHIRALQRDWDTECQSSRPDLLHIMQRSVTLAPQWSRRVEEALDSLVGIPEGRSSEREQLQGALHSLLLLRWLGHPEMMRHSRERKATVLLELQRQLGVLTSVWNDGSDRSWMPGVRYLHRLLTEHIRVSVAHEAGWAQRVEPES